MFSFMISDRQSQWVDPTRLWRHRDMNLTATSDLPFCLLTISIVSMLPTQAPAF